MRAIIFYKTESGQSPVEDFLRSLSDNMKSEERIDELQTFINEQKALHPGFAEGYEEGYRHFVIGVMLKQARINAGLTQIEVAEKLKTHKSAISRIENHAENIKLSTLANYAEAIGKQLDISIH